MWDASGCCWGEGPSSSEKPLCSIRKGKKEPSCMWHCSSRFTSTQPVQVSSYEQGDQPPSLEYSDNQRHFTKLTNKQHRSRLRRPWPHIQEETYIQLLTDLPETDFQRVRSLLSPLLHLWGQVMISEAGGLPEELAFTRHKHKSTADIHLLLPLTERCRTCAVQAETRRFFPRHTTGGDGSLKPSPGSSQPSFKPVKTALASCYQVPKRTV